VFTIASEKKSERKGRNGRKGSLRHPRRTLCVLRVLPFARNERSSPVGRQSQWTTGTCRAVGLWSIGKNA